MKLSRRFVRVASIIFLAPVAVGCTPEKAEALLASIKSYRGSSERALQAIEGIYLASNNTLAGVTDVDKFNTFYNQNKLDTGTPINEFYNDHSKYGNTAAGSAALQVSTVLLPLRATFVELDQAYASLPAGSVVGAKYVSCGKQAIAKLTSSLLKTWENTQRRPPYPAIIKLHLADAAIYAKVSDRQKSLEKYTLAANELKAFDEKMDKAAELTLVAVRQGGSLYELLDKYDNVSVDVILKTLQFGLDFASSLDGVSTTGAARVLKDAISGVDSSEYWKQIAAKDLGSISGCPLQLVGKQP